MAPNIHFVFRSLWVAPRVFLRSASVLAAVACLAAGAAAQTRSIDVNLENSLDNRVCFGCHGGTAAAGQPGSRRGRPQTVDSKEYQGSAHANRACTDCHEDVKTIPHAVVAEVRCERCHPMGDRPVAAKRGAQAPSESVHERALRMGREDAPACKDCHGTHDISGPAASGSRVSRTNIPTTCGRCHLDEYSHYRACVHGEAVAQGHSEAAVCTDCHGEHTGLLPKDDPESRINPLRVPDTCSKCHESAPLMKRYGLPPARHATYRDSYHGIIAQYGDVSAANCASCHGYHDILPSNNPKSRVHRSNLPTTCGECHPGATENFARGTVHLMPSPEHDAVVYWVRKFYRGFIFALMAQFVGLIALDLLARGREARRRGGRQ